MGVRKLLNYEIPDYVINPDPDFYLSDNYLVLDFETTNIEKGDPINEDNHIVLGAWWRANESNVRLLNRRDGERELFDAIGEVDFIVCHNAKFELQWLSRIPGS